MEPTGNGASNRTLTLKEIHSYITNVIGGYKSRFTWREKQGHKALGENSLDFINTQCNLKASIETLKQLQDHLRGTFGDGA